jgi:hypothetical protein
VKGLQFFFLQGGSPAEKEPGGLLGREGQEWIGRERRKEAILVFVAAEPRETFGNADGFKVAK